MSDNGSVTIINTDVDLTGQQQHLIKHNDTTNDKYEKNTDEHGHVVLIDVASLPVSDEVSNDVASRCSIAYDQNDNTNNETEHHTSDRLEKTGQSDGTADDTLQSKGGLDRSSNVVDVLDDHQKIDDECNANVGIAEIFNGTCLDTEEQKRKHHEKHEYNEGILSLSSA